VNRESGTRAAQEREKEGEEFLGVLDEIARPFMERMSDREMATFRLMLMAITAARNAETLGDPKSAEDFVRQAGLIMETFGVTPEEEETASGLLDIVRDLRGLFDRQKEEEAKQAGKLVIAEKFQRRKPQESHGGRRSWISSHLHSENSFLEVLASPPIRRMFRSMSPALPNLSTVSRIFE
jgi:hypothetical protein